MTHSSDQPLPIEISVLEVKQLLDGDEEFLLIDCREQTEYDHCRIEKSYLLPMDETPARLAELEPHRDKRIVVHCHHGSRSMQVTHYLRQQGFELTQNMAGGIDAWSQDVDPGVTRY
jgi:rhodanese-related sulfurtransferase